MATSYNKAILIGHLVRDTEIRYTPNGTPVTTFSIAVNRKYKVGDETKDEVSYFDVVVFGKQAESANQYLAKGLGVLVDGRLNQRRWEDKETGQKRSKVEIIAEVVRFMGKKSDTVAPEYTDADIAPHEVTDDDVPF